MSLYKRKLYLTILHCTYIGKVSGVRTHGADFLVRCKRAGSIDTVHLHKLTGQCMQHAAAFTEQRDKVNDWISRMRYHLPSDY